MKRVRNTKILLDNTILTDSKIKYEIAHSSKNILDLSSDSEKEEETDKNGAVSIFKVPPKDLSIPKSEIICKNGHVMSLID